MQLPLSFFVEFSRERICMAGIFDAVWNMQTSHTHLYLHKFIFKFHAHITFRLILLYKHNNIVPFSYQ